MRRIFIDGPLGETMTVNGELARHIGLSLRMAVPIPAQAIRERLAIHEELVHLTIEIAQG